MSWSNCHDHDVDYRDEDGCPVCALCIERDTLKAKVTGLEAENTALKADVAEWSEWASKHVLTHIVRSLKPEQEAL